MTADGEQLFKAAEEFLSKKLKDEGVSDPGAILDKYRQPESRERDFRSMPDVMKRMLESWINAQGKKGAIGDIADLTAALDGFDHKKILNRLEGIPEDRKAHELLEHISRTTGKPCTPRTSRSHWPQFTKGIITICRFLEAFDDAEDFHRWVKKFSEDPDTAAALPMVLAAEIHGFGFALPAIF